MKKIQILATMTLVVLAGSAGAQMSESDPLDICWQNIPIDPSGVWNPTFGAYSGASPGDPYNYVKVNLSTNNLAFVGGAQCASTFQGQTTCQTAVSGAGSGPMSPIWSVVNPSQGGGSVTAEVFRCFEMPVTGQEICSPVPANTHACSFQGTLTRTTSVEKTASALTVGNSDSVSFVVSAINTDLRSDFTTENIQISDPVPAFPDYGLTLQLVDPGNFSCTTSGQNVTCTLAEMQGAWDEEVTIQAIAYNLTPFEQTVTNCASIQYTNIPTVGVTMEDCVTITIAGNNNIPLPEADLAVTPYPAGNVPASMTVGQSHDFQGRWRNYGPSESGAPTTVTVTTNIGSLSPGTFAGGSCSGSGQLLTCTRGPAPPDGTARWVNFTFTAPASPGTAEICKSITSGVTDPDLSNNQYCVQIPILGAGRTLSVNSTGATGVSIGASPPTIADVTNYTRPVNDGQQIVLAAPAWAGDSPSFREFSNWTGCDSVGGTGGRDCSLTISGNRSVFANYLSADVRAVGWGGDAPGGTAGEADRAIQFQAINDGPALARDSRVTITTTVGGLAPRPSDTWNCSNLAGGGFSAAQRLVCQRGDRTSGANIATSFSQVLTEGGSGQLCARVDSNTHDPNEANNQLCQNFEVIGQARVLSVNSSPVEGAFISSSTGHGGTTNYISSVIDGEPVSLVAPSWISDAPDMRQFSAWSGCDSVGGAGGRTCGLLVSSDRDVTANYLSADVRAVGWGGDAPGGTAGEADRAIQFQAINDGPALARDSRVTITTTVGGLAPRPSDTWNCSNLAGGGFSAAQRLVCQRGDRTSGANIATSFSQVLTEGGSGQLCARVDSNTHDPNEANNQLCRDFAVDQTHQVSVTSVGAAGVDIVGTPGYAGGTTNYVRSVTHGEQIQLAAPPEVPGWSFRRWIGCDIVSGPQNAICQAEISGNREISAEYDRQVTVTVVSVGPSAVAVTAIPPSAGGQTTYTIDAIEGDSITLIAPLEVVSGGQVWAFVAWQNCDSTSSDGRDCMIVASERTVEAVYLAADLRAIRLEVPGEVAYGLHSGASFGWGNWGPSASGDPTEVIITGQGGLSFGSASSPGGACNNTDDGFVCAHGGIPPDQVERATEFSMTAAEGFFGQAEVCASIASDVFDPVPSNNEICTSVVVRGRLVDIDVLSVGANQVQIDGEDEVHSGVTDYTVSARQGDTLTLTAPPSADGRTFALWQACPQVIGDDGRVCQVNVVDDEQVVVRYGVADLSVRGITGPSSAAAGTTEEFQSSFMNMGPDPSGQFQIEITISSGQLTSIDDGTYSCSILPGDGRRAVCDIENLDPSDGIQAVSWSMTTPEAQGQVQVCTNAVPGDTIDPDLSNNSFCRTLSVTAPETRVFSVVSIGASTVDIESASSSQHRGITNYQRTVDAGTVVVLAAPETHENSIFSHWDNCDSVQSNGRVCISSIEEDRILEAHYISNDYQLTVLSEGAEGVEVVSNPDGYGGITDYSVNIAENEAVWLFAPTEVDDGQGGLTAFVSWSGCDSVAGAGCLVTMTSDRQVTANYTSADAQADLVTIKSGAETVYAAESATFVISVSNLGPDNATGVQVIDTLPDGVIFSSAGGADWNCTHAGQEVQCLRAGVLAAGAVAPNLRVTVIAPREPGIITNTAAAFANEADPNPGIATDTHEIEVLPSADLAIAKTGPGTVASGGQVEYRVTVKNFGPSTSTTMAVESGVPANATLQSAGGAGWSCSQSSSTVICSRGSDLAPNSVTPSLVLTFDVGVSQAQSSVTSCSEVGSSIRDPNMSNNAACQSAAANPDTGIGPCN